MGKIEGKDGVDNYSHKFLYNGKFIQVLFDLFLFLGQTLYIVLQYIYIFIFFFNFQIFTKKNSFTLFVFT